MSSGAEAAMSDLGREDRSGSMESVLQKNILQNRIAFLRKSGIRILFFSAILLAWHLLAKAGIWNELLFPAPGQVLDALAAGFGDGSMFQAITASMKRLLLGYGISLLIGIPLGLLLGRIAILDNTVGTLAMGLQALPSICWLPLAVLWFGLSEGSMQFVVVMGSLMALTQSVRDGVKTIPRLYLRASRVLGATRWKGYLYVIIPASMPSILIGAKMGWSFAWRSLMAAELLYVNTGLGSTLQIGRELHDMALVVATMIVIIIIGLITDRLVFKNLEKSMHRRWGVERQ
jgi:NitT/TauT family transport system permease protein